MNKSKKDKGFNLLELLITLAIIAILVSLAIPSYRTYITKTKYAEAILILTDCSKRIQADYFIEDQFPRSACGVAKGSFGSIGSSSIEEVYYDNDGTNAWFAVIFKPTVVPGATWEERALHIGGKYDNATDDFIWYCGRWDSSYFVEGDMSLLSKDCNVNGVAAML